ncbi:MAG: DUF4278 domain-containing protein [Cyanobacteria bacterium J06648_16]
MKLSHLGATYNYTPRQIETVETDIECQFLGKTAKLRIPKQPLNHRNQDMLKYRGVSYRA